MRIIIDQAEIEEAIENLILDQVQVPDHVDIKIDLRATRGELGFQAHIDFVDPNNEVQPNTGEHLGIADKVRVAKEEAAKPRRRGRPKGSLNKPKAAPAPAPAVEPVAVPEVVAEASAEANTSGDTRVDNLIDEVSAQSSDNAPQVAEAVVEDAAVEMAKEEAPAPEPVEPEPVASASDVTEADVSSQASPELAANVTETAAEQVVEQEQVPAPELAVAPVAEAAPAAPAAPARSLFANLGNPKNEG